ncbi:MAG: aminopeptidase N [Halieaceae bacterium]|nr:aminopeptidase N [Halieaceae bacterium]
MRDAQPNAIYLKDYQPPAYLIDETHLDFQLAEEQTVVEARLKLRRNPAAEPADVLELDGAELELLEIEIDGTPLDEGAYTLTDEHLHLLSPPEEFELRCVTRIAPQDNTSLEGLYKSRTMFCTQCEAEGFRKITYYLDRPDVMSVFTVRVEADSERYPVLLSNGNLVDSKATETGRHWTLWNDPFPKPAYLFALVAGELEKVSDTFTTTSGRDVALHIFVEAKDLDKCDHAMRSLKHSMRWDEEVYGREYDLDVFNIVAVDDFNMGAMENKSLNIFNTSCVLAHPDTTTDQAFQRVEAVVAHEYFHNWSGNRVTCRDWFQLSLKEGFTVFRDAEFSADMGSRAVKRVEDATVLRSIQFAEDAGPMSHPVRPDSYIEISNFYTVTIYEKGAEVVRMIHTLLGPADFRRGSDLYFERHDGQAVTCEDFVAAMEDASGRDLSQFRRWYSQAGTPELAVSDNWDEATGTYTLTVSQHCPPTPGQPEKEPFHIPLKMGLLGDAGSLRLQIEGEAADTESEDNTSRVLEVTEASQQFAFSGLPERPVPSLLRAFSAPVKLHYPYTREQLAFIMSRDSDGFSRWDASQQLAIQVIGDAQSGAVDPLLIDAFGSLLQDDSLDPAMVAETLRMPSENYLADLAETVDVEAIHRGRQAVRTAIGKGLNEALLQRYRALASDASYQPDSAQVAARSLRNSCLAYLAQAGEAGVELAMAQYHEAANMTDRQAALATVVNCGNEAQRTELLEDFYQAWQHESLVVNQWFQVQAMCPQPGNLERVRALMEHPAFSLRNPNKVRALVGAFCSANPINFHRADGAGYQLLVDVVTELNATNPQIASRLLTPLTRWRRYGERREQMRAALEAIAALPSLSKDVYEVVTKSLTD